MQESGVLYNTYWIRFARGRMTVKRAAENTRTLFEAAERAGVERIVYFSVTNPSPESGLPYFRAKAQVEDLLMGKATIRARSSSNANWLTMWRYSTFRLRTTWRSQ